MLKSEAAAYLAGVTQTEGAEASAPTNLHVITGEVGEASADGKTLVKIDGLMFSESDDQFIEVDALGGLEEGDIATIVLTGEQGHAMTPLALGSIGSVDRITVRIAAIEADYIKVEQLDAAEARIGELEADHVSVDDLNAATARIGTLETTRATITDLEAAEARIGTLESDHVSTDDLDAATARIGTLETNTADIGTIRANSAKVQNLTAAELEADHAAIEALDSNYAHITNGVIDNATIGYADVNNLSAHYAEIQNGKIDSALINTAAIVDEQVFTVTGNKATLAQIDASKINVLNLKAKDIEVERINGQPVTNKTLVDALSQHETDISDLDTKIDNEVEALNDRIDGAIETFTGTVVPTLDNTPASQWNTAKLKVQHVGDVYYVVNSQSAQNGYCYRFTKSGSTYSWQLIKDSDVTAALSRLQTAEGKIGDIEQFDVTVGSFMTDTDDELSSLKTRTTSLETSMGDKVDTSTFNTVSQKVDENSASISTLSETVSTKADSSTVTTLSNTVNTVKQTADTNKASITSLTQTVNNKADGTTVTTLTNRVSTVEQNLDGITTRVGETEQSLESVANPNLTPYFSHSINDVYSSTNTNGYWVQAHATVPAVTNDWSFEQSGPDGTGGWAHFDVANTGTSTAYLDSYIRKTALDLKPSTKYTFLVEWFNVTSSGGTPILYTTTQHGGTNGINDDYFSTTTSVNIASGSGSSYISATTRATLESGCYNRIRTHLWIGKGITTSGYIRISLYEGEYGGPYKPYVDQTLSNRVKSAETSIEQNAEDITLRATKAEFNALSIGGRNFLISSEAERVVSLTSATGSAFYTEYINESEYGKSITNGNVDDVFVLSFDWTTTSADGVAWVQVDGNIIANPIDGNGGTSDGSRGKNYLDLGYGSGRYWVAFKYTSTQAGKAQQRIRIRVSGAEVSTKPLTTNSTFSASHFKLEKGTRPTDWTPAPEDMATAAELKVANDNINLKVSKNDVINQINVSTEGVKIDADRLTIDGTAVFNAAKSKLDAAYDAKGAAATAESNAKTYTDALEIGGRNLLPKTGSADGYYDNTVPSGNHLTTVNDDGECYERSVTSTSANISMSSNVALVGLESGSEYTISMMVKSTVARTYGLQLRKNNNGADGGEYVYQPGVNVAANTWTRLTHSFTGPSDAAVYARLYCAAGTACTVRMRELQLERGNKATDWTPAPEDQTAYVDAVQVGGRNLLQDSDQVLENGSVLDTKTLFACFLWSTPAKGYTGYKQIMPYTNVNSVGRFALTFEAMDVSQEYWCIKHNGTQHDYARYFKNSVDVKQGDALTLSFDVVKFNPSIANGLEIKNFKLERGNKATDWTPAPEDIEANAVKRTQRIWYRTNASSAPATPGTASSNWVTKADDGNDAWTKMHIAISSTHKYIYTCEQYEMANGTVGYTSVLLDNTITVIDGGNIITGSVTANKLNAANINASKSLTVGAMTDAAASTILNSNVQVGGRNLLFQTSSFSGSGTSTSYFIEYTVNNGALKNSVALEAGVEYTFSADVTSSREPFQMTIGVGTGSYSRDISYGPGETLTSGRISITFKLTAAQLANGAIFAFRAPRYGTQGTSFTYTVARPKLEKGNKATDWTPAPEDQTAYTDSIAYQTSKPNLSPYFSSLPYNSDNPYWNTFQTGSGYTFTDMGDGWMRVQVTNSGTSTIRRDFFPIKSPTVEPGKDYTFLVEFRNNASSGTASGTDCYLVQTNNYQFWGGGIKKNLEGKSSSSTTNLISDFVPGTSGVYTKRFVKTSEAVGSSHWTSGDEANVVGLAVFTCRCAPNTTIDYELRISLYEGEYTGPYKPYSGDQLYATNTELASTNESLEGAIADIGELSDQLVDTTTEQNKTITDIQKYLNSLRQDLDAEIQSRQQWLNFNAAEGLIIGAAGSTFKTVTTNTSQQFRSGGTVLAETSGSEFVAPVMRSDQILIGNWMWTRRDNGNLSLKWIG